MNKTVIYVTFVILICLALIEAMVLLLFAPEHFSTLTSFVIILLGLASTFAATVWSLGKNNKEIEKVKEETSAKLDVVQRQTNGTLTRLIEQGDEKTLVIHEQKDQLSKKDAEIAELRIMAGLPPKMITKGNDDE